MWWIVCLAAAAGLGVNVLNEPTITALNALKAFHGAELGRGGNIVFGLL